MALKYFLLSLWRLQRYEIYLLIPIIAATIIMILSGHRSARGVNYKKLLLWELIFMAMAVSTFAFGYFWATQASAFGALNADIVAGITILFMLLQVIVLGIFLGVIGEGESKKGARER